MPRDHTRSRPAEATPAGFNSPKPALNQYQITYVIGEADSEPIRRPTVGNVRCKSEYSVITTIKITNTMSTLQLVSILAAAALYFGFYHLNELLFSALEFHKGANWVFLPAGLRLLCTLILGGEGAIGLLLASLAITFGTLNADIANALVAPAISAGAPYLIYRFALIRGMPATLEQLNAKSLSVLIVMYAAASSLLHSVWYTLRGISSDFLTGLTAMFVGDLIGTVIVIYSIKLLLAIFERFRKRG